ncbi:alpha/beta fold hydrolase [Streptomyces sp. NPDC090442]|uniref:alpha/beta fold hydrolase n=1 Tax=Streptomyces sp. NPDC090442 TaxID=3365962 RepID=UPI0037FFE652
MGSGVQPGLDQLDQVTHEGDWKVQRSTSSMARGGGVGKERLCVAVPAVVVALGLMAPSTAVADPGSESSTGRAMDWQPCVQVAEGWDQQDKATECAMVEVPLDYAQPDGRTIRIAVSRIKASDPAKRRGALFINPGGPGTEGLTEPRRVLASEMRDLGKRFDLVGFDIRGTGRSDKPGCPELAFDNFPQPPAGLTGKERMKFLDEAYGKALTTCANKEPDLSRSMTTVNAARDMDRVRTALGERKISYFGKSWGTALGASYRSQFDARVDRMVLDSVITSWQSVDDAEAQLAARQRRYQDFTAWMAERDDRLGLGRTAADVSEKLLALRTELEKHPRGSVTADTFNSHLLSPRARWASAAQALSDIAAGKTPTGALSPVPAMPTGNSPERGFGRPMQDGDMEFVLRAVNCNGASGQRDFEAGWEESLKDKQKYPVAGYAGGGTMQCSGWPFPGRHEQLGKGTSPLQLFGHAFETNTVLPRAQQMKQTVGGSLSIIKDDVHVSLQDLAAPAKDAVAFLTGRSGPFERSYDGKAVPDLE